MSRQDVVSRVLAEAKRRLPTYVVRVESVQDDEDAIGVGVFSVPASARRDVYGALASVEFTLLEGTRYSIVPLIRTPEATAAYYPELAPEEAFAELVPIAEADCLAAAVRSTLGAVVASKVGPRPAPVWADDDLALAA